MLPHPLGFLGLAKLRQLTMRSKLFWPIAIGQLAFPSPIEATLSNSKDCKSFPGTDSWPTTNQWNKLNETISGRLIKPLAPAGVCHPEQPNFNEGQCNALTDGGEWAGYYFHIDDPVSMMWNNWANSTCSPDPSKPCSTEGYPAYVLRAESAQDIKAGVDFG